MNAKAEKRDDDVVLSVRDAKKHYPIREGTFQRIVGYVRAVDGVSFDIGRGQTVGLVGESGCGKTTLGRVVSGLSELSDGGVFYNIDGTMSRIENLRGRAARHFRRNCQMVFQDSFASLNPRSLVVDIVGRPLRVYRESSGAEVTESVVGLLQQVGLGREHLFRYPHQFSGGQQQRISIARALALDPEVIVLDEPTSALDVSVQAQILNLLSSLQNARNLAYLFVAHDLSVVRHMADTLVVMYLGKVVETGKTGIVFDTPHHPYTKALIDAKPDFKTGGARAGKGLEGMVPDPARPPQGCRFHTRCEMATAKCGWEIDDVVRWLEDAPGMFDNLSGVERRSDFSATLTFESEQAAGQLSKALRSDNLPPSMRGALKGLNLKASSVEIEFHEIDPIQLTDRGLQSAACILDPAVVQKRN